MSEQLPVCTRLEPALSFLSFVVFAAPPREGGDARKATIVSPGRLYRCPTGTATSARPPCSPRRGAWAPTTCRSIIDTASPAAWCDARRSATHDAVVPAITGRAWITGYHQLVLDPTDPLGDGFKLPDTWGSGSFEGTLNP